MKWTCLAVGLMALAWVNGAVAQIQPPQEQRTTSLDQMTIPELMNAALRMWNENRREEGFSLLEIILKRDPANLEALVQRGDWYWDSQNADKARQSWLTARSIDANNFRANLGLGRMYVRSRYAHQALGYLEAAVAVAPADRRAEALTELAKAYRGSGTGGITRAILTAERALEAFQPGQDPFEAWVLLVALRVSVQDFERAMSDSDRMLEVARKNVEEKRSSHESLVQLHIAYETRGRVLVDYLRAFMATGPSGVVTDRPLPGREADVARLIRMVIDLKLRQSELQAMLSDFPLVSSAEQAVTYERTNPQNWMTLGYLLTRTFQYEKAASAYLEAHRIDPGNADIKAQTRQAIVTLLRIDPNNEVARAELDKLDGIAPASADPGPGLPSALSPEAPAPIDADIDLSEFVIPELEAELTPDHDSNQTPTTQPATP